MICHCRDARADEVDHIDTTFKEMGWSKPAGYFADIVRAAAKGDLRFLIALSEEGRYVGHLKIIWQPTYPYFRENNIPEIQDLNVLPAYRRQGVATQLVAMAEEIVAKQYARIGIGFGLYADYGAAQRMYVQRDYVPIGDGAASHDKPIVKGRTVPVDDELVLYMVKALRPTAAQIASHWNRLYLAQGLIAVDYPGRTPLGSSVDLVSKNLGGGTQLHLISRSSHEIYFELAAYPERKQTNDWERFLSPIREAKAVHVGELRIVDLAGVPAEQCLLTFPDKRRLVHFFTVGGTLCRLLYDPNASLNYVILSTLNFEATYQFP